MSHERKTVSTSTGSEGAQFSVGSEAVLAAQLEKVLSSDYFRGSHTSRRLLEYIVTHSMDGNLSELKEFTIGVEALGRKPDFDPKLDGIVRVQVHRIRQKLADYYAMDGRQDPIRILIPRGSYRAEFSIQELSFPEQVEQEVEFAKTTESPLGNPTDSVEETGEAPEKNSFETGDKQQKRFLFSVLPQQWIWPAASLVFAIVCMLAGYLFGRNHKPIQTRSYDDPVARLWLQMLGNDVNPIISYPSDVHLLDESNDLLSFYKGAVGRRGSVVDPHVAQQFAVNKELVAHAGTLYYDDGYTGTGELESVGMLVGLLHDLGLHPAVKRMKDISSEDLRDHNVIMLGSGALTNNQENLPSPGNFQFAAAKSAAWGMVIKNAHPLPGEQAAYYTQRQADTKTVLEDYAVISYQPGIIPTKRILILGGMDTTGTIGATSFLTSADGAQLVLNQMQSVGASEQQHPFFQEVIHCNIKDGDDVFSTKAVAFHHMPWKAE